MTAPSTGAAVIVLATGLLALSGCPSAYQRTYERETQRLEAQQQADLAREEAAHKQAQKYAAVVYFSVGSAVIDEDGLRELRWFVQQMQPYPQAVIDVQGFADSTGSEAANQDLSQQRAQAVAAYLDSQGIALSRLVVRGFGTISPADSNATAQGRRNNRRVEVTVQ
jgi:outer membrane protein OmpA-like peptidoglycan-associated protein